MMRLAISRSRDLLAPGARYLRTSAANAAGSSSEGMSYYSYRMHDMTILASDTFRDADCHELELA